MRSNRNAVSMPLLRAKTPKDAAPAPKCRTGSTAGTPGNSLLSQADDGALGASPRERTATSCTSGLLPRVSTATGARPQPQVPPGGELLNLQAPATVSSKLIFQRMESTTKALAKGSFAEYMKEYDIFTGEPRRARIDWEEVQEMEDDTIRASQKLIGGKVKKRIGPMAHTL